MALSARTDLFLPSPPSLPECSTTTKAFLWARGVWERYERGESEYSELQQTRSTRFIFTKVLLPHVKEHFANAKFTYGNFLRKVNGTVCWDRGPGRPSSCMHSDAYSASIDVRGRQVSKEGAMTSVELVQQVYVRSGLNIKDYKHLKKVVNARVKEVDPKLSSVPGHCTSKARTNACNKETFERFFNDVQSLLDVYPELKEDAHRWW